MEGLPGRWIATGTELQVAAPNVLPCSTPTDSLIKTQLICTLAMCLQGSIKPSVYLCLECCLSKCWQQLQCVFDSKFHGRTDCLHRAFPMLQQACNSAGMSKMEPSCCCCLLSRTAWLSGAAVDHECFRDGNCIIHSSSRQPCS